MPLRAGRWRLAMAAAAMIAAGPAFAQEPEGARPEVAKPLAAAEAEIRAKHYDGAAAQLSKAEAVKGRSSYESFLIEQTTGVLAQARGDVDGALKSFKDVLASGRVPTADKGRIEQTIAGLDLQKQDYAGAADYIQRAMKDGNKDPTLPGLLIQAYYQGGDYKNAAALTQQAIADQKKAGKPPTEAQLQMLASCAQKQKDDAGFASALEQLAINYPSQDVWGNIVARIQAKPAAGRLSLDVARLKLKLGLLKTAPEFESAAQEAIADFPGEGVSFIQAGFDAGVLGQPADAARQKRLKDYADKQLAADKASLPQKKQDADESHTGQDDVRVGYDMVTQGDLSGIAMIEQGIKKGSLSRPDQTKLLLAYSYLKANRTPDAITTFKTVQGDGTSDLAHVWLLVLQAKPKAA